MYGYQGRLLFVDLSDGSIETRELSETLARAHLSGASLGARILYEEMPAHTPAFSEDSMIGFLAGVTNATGALFGGRYTVVSKSPVYDGWNDANSGGSFGPALKRSGYDAVFIRGIAKEPVALWIIDGEATIRSAEHLWGKCISEADGMLRQEADGRDIETAMIGPAGERMNLTAAIINNTHRAAGRGGSGAVMGSKKLKAIVVGGKRTTEVADRSALKEINHSVLSYMEEGPTVPAVMGYRAHGTGVSYAASVLSGDAGVKNWAGVGMTDMTQEQIDAVDASSMDARFKTKQYACMQCPLACGADYEVKEGKWPIGKTYRPEYETMGVFGSQLLNGDPTAVIACNHLCNEYGLDTIAVGGTVGWAMECFDKGLLTEEDLDGIALNWGDAEAIVALTEKICRGEGCGAWLANGSRQAVRTLGRGEEALVEASGIEIPHHDARLAPGLSRTYQYDPTPGRHVKGGLGIGYGGMPPEVKYNYENTGEADAQGIPFFENVNATGFCLFTLFGMPPGTDRLMINAITGFDYTEEEFQRHGLRAFMIRHAFNLREGKTRADFRLSDRMNGRPPLTEGPLAGVEIDNERLADNFFTAMGCTLDMVPKRETLEEIGGLDCVIRDLYA